MSKEKKSILIVDDEFEIRDILLKYLESNLEEYYLEFLQADSGNMAFELWQNHSIDLILTDVRMKNGTGKDLLINLKGEESSTKVVVITGFSDYEDKELIDLGAITVLRKPIDLEILDKTIRAALSK